MSTSHEFVSELARDITSAVAEKEWASVSADLTVLAEQVVQALIDHREQDVKNAYEAVESAYSTLVTGFQVEDSVADAKSAASELRAYTRLLSVALAYRSSPAIQEIALDHRFRPLLEKLLPWPDGMSGRELAKALYVRPETIARKLPILRAANLVRSQQVGKATINTITAEAREFLEQKDRAVAEAEDQKDVAAAAAQ
jgi:hypothetical protein